MTNNKQILDKYIKIGHFPTIIDDVHESAFRSYQILKILLEMIKRNDSRETMIEIITLLTSFPPKVMNRREVTKVMDDEDIEQKTEKENVAG